jgi:hypothetical protein
LTAQRCPKATFLAFWTGFWRNGYRDLDFAFFGDNPDLYRSSAFDNWRLSSADSRGSLPFTGSEFVAFSTWCKAFLLASRSDIMLTGAPMGRKVNRRRKPEPEPENVHEFLSRRGLAASLGQRISLPLHGFLNQAGDAPSVWARNESRAASLLRPSVSALQSSTTTAARACSAL